MKTCNLCVCQTWTTTHEIMYFFFSKPSIFRPLSLSSIHPIHIQKITNEPLLLNLSTYLLLTYFLIVSA